MFSVDTCVRHMCTKISFNESWKTLYGYSDVGQSQKSDDAYDSPVTQINLYDFSSLPENADTFVGPVVHNCWT